MIIYDNEFSFPLIQENPTTLLSTGTAFYIGNNVFMTAGHCLPDTFDKSFSVLVPCDLNHDQMVQIVIGEIENLGCDIGIFKLTEPTPKRVKSRKWMLTPIKLGMDVIITGYPLTSFTPQTTESLYTRTFRTCIMARRKWDRFGEPIVYELLGLCPKGMSGSAVEWIPTGNDLHKNNLFPISAVLVANESQSFEIFRSKSEELIDGTRTIIVNTKEEAFHFGLAISTESISNLVSNKILGGITIRDHLEKVGLIFK